MTYNSFLKLSETLSRFIWIHSKSMKTPARIIKMGIAKNASDAKRIQNQYAQYKHGKCSYTRLICTIVYLWYEYKNICFENAKGVKAHLDWIINEEFLYNNQIKNKKDKIYAFEKFMTEI